MISFKWLILQNYIKDDFSVNIVKPSTLSSFISTSSYISIMILEFVTGEYVTTCFTFKKLMCIFISLRGIFPQNKQVTLTQDCNTVPFNINIWCETKLPKVRATLIQTVQKL